MVVIRLPVEMRAKWRQAAALCHLSFEEWARIILDQRADELHSLNETILSERKENRERPQDRQPVCLD